ncbi:MAG: hypothetical protein IPG96_19195 [Proteobacteria bacterium]|nr:hypothetical protein [Pseudomonadota bacterium]
MSGEAIGGEQGQGQVHPAVLGLFDKRLEGDDTLLQLARLRFERAGIGAEVYPGAPERLNDAVGQAPENAVTLHAHLPRGLNLLREDDRRWVVEFARRSPARVRGLVAHDQWDVVENPDEYRAALRRIDAELRALGRPEPRLFVEYAVGVEASRFVALFASLADLSQVSACIDVGHLGIQQARVAFAARRPGLDICALKPYDEALPALMPEVEGAMQTVLPWLLEQIEPLARIGKPLHFHLHDGHPLWSFSRYGVADHASFLEQVVVPFDFRGQPCVPMMYGPAGLRAIVATALRWLPAPQVTFTLEIHPVEGRQPLGAFAPYFRHWRDTTNAERMNYWMTVLLRNAQLTRDAATAALAALAAPLAQAQRIE